CVACRQCRHEREIEPRVLANILGWNVTLKQACTRLRCSKCQSRKFQVEIAFNPRPRAWKGNPSYTQGLRGSLRAELQFRQHRARHAAAIDAAAGPGASRLLHVPPAAAQSGRPHTAAV